MKKIIAIASLGLACTSVAIANTSRDVSVYNQSQQELVVSYDFRNEGFPFAGKIVVQEYRKTLPAAPNSKKASDNTPPYVVTVPEFSNLVSFSTWYPIKQDPSKTSVPSWRLVTCETININSGINIVTFEDHGGAIICKVTK